MLKISKNKILLLVGSLVVIALFILSPLPKILAQTAMSVTGYSWSDGIGWIGMGSDSGGNVAVDPTTGNFSGYAWSDHIGWVNMAGVKVPVSGGKPVANSDVTGNAQVCSVLSAGCAGSLVADDLRGGWDGVLSMYNVKVGNDGKTLSGYAWSDLNTMYVDLTGLVTEVAPVTTYSLSVTRVAGDTTGVVSVSPVDINKTNVYPQTPVTTVTLTAKNSAASPVPTCWTVDGTPVVVAAAPASSYTVTMSDSHAVVVGCASVAPVGCETNPSLCGCSGTGCVIPTCLGGSCSCGSLANCDCTGTPQAGYSCTEDTDTSDITNISIVTGSVSLNTPGIRFFKADALSYARPSDPFTVKIEGGGPNYSIGFDWAHAVNQSSGGSAFPLSCVNSIRVISASGSCNGSNVAGEVAAIAGDGSYRLCFIDKCLNTATGLSKLNGVWTVLLTNNGTAVDGLTTKLNFNDTRHY
ncbi:MAG: hypothetical protein WCW56_02520 [Candidatus Paceibacterota bacterium]